MDYVKSANQSTKMSPLYHSRKKRLSLLYKPYLPGYLGHCAYSDTRASVRTNGGGGGGAAAYRRWPGERPSPIGGATPNTPPTAWRGAGAGAGLLARAAGGGQTRFGGDAGLVCAAGSPTKAQSSPDTC